MTFSHVTVPPGITLDLLGSLPAHDLVPQDLSKSDVVRRTTAALEQMRKVWTLLSGVFGAAADSATVPASQVADIYVKCVQEFTQFASVERVLPPVSTLVPQQPTQQQQRSAVVSKEQQEKLEQLSRFIPGVIYQYRMRPNGSSHFPYASDGIRDIYFVSPADVADDASIVFSRIHPDDTTEVSKKIIESAQSMNPWVQEYRTLFEGKERWLYGQAQPELCSDGSILWHGYICDITERKQSEKQMREATLAAEAANRAKSAFLSTVSHETRTPLNSVISMLELLLDERNGNMNAEQRNYCEIARSSAEAMLLLVNTILDFSKIEAGKLDLELQDFDLWPVLDEVIDMTAHRAQQKGIELACIVQPANFHGLVRADPVRLRQILLNLVSNAVKFTQQGEVVLRVSLESEKPDDTSRRLWYRFQVDDTGPGIPNNMLDRLFKPFSQVDSLATRRFTSSGSGLGLAISKQLVELMGGHIGVKTAEGQGSSFFVSIPFDISSSPTQQDNNENHSQDSLLQGKRVLVVDGNSTSRTVLSTFLDAWHCEHVEVATACEAEDMIREAHANGKDFSLVLLGRDLVSENNDKSCADGVQFGQELLRKSAAEGWALPPVLLMIKAFVDRPSEILRLKSLGFAGTINKPIKKKDLYSCLVSVLASQKQSYVPSPATHVLSNSSDGSQPLEKNNSRILVVEDNPINTKVALLLLKRLGYLSNVVDVAENGEVALDKLSKSHYDLVLMDLSMPVMDGITATTAIRKGRSSVLDPNVVIVAMTANAGLADKELCFSCGMQDFLSKPVRVQDLAAVLDKWLK